MNKINIRIAKKEDLQAIVKLIADDDIVGSREIYSEPLNEIYIKAFDTIDKDSNNELIIAESESKILGTLQITYIPYIINKGQYRALIEAVMISQESTGMGIGTKMMKWAIQLAKDKKCCIVQLTTNKKRLDAHRFYERLGLKSTHEGMKLEL